MSAWKVMIVDDHPLMRRGIGQLLSFEAEFDVIGEASNGNEAIALAHKTPVDLILLDLNMKGMSGLDTLITLRNEGIDACIVILTVSDNHTDIKALIDAGADGYLLKDTEPDELIALLKTALMGGKAYCEIVTAFLSNNSADNTILSSLTDRENQILQEVAKGHTNRVIAESLFISEATVKVHMKSLLRKLQVKSRTAATVLYLQTLGY
ncbi:nitrate/nitrite response regulator [Photobacterium kishitanii]|uniref:DNA-binding response regulator n=1 Tax=Photobacterium kishitanii TaxID=318456 RepID=A0AAX0Z294_9GAMM|nr:response regulator [Photobacterium kishitanii]KJG57574.1 nitrate/nitrite response regulator [Photobacterium kishitanii]KJG61232.1 nitrate/nitrite response regulator [Photobacterium kishitanii]KJG65421.1 nitrate/nitrite response regulator [Photobacterium kishitanii]KJG69525.1 nitrate/nitrite response regulator [Photobacterium kishitanii]OBU31587.1 DNA-binding response regulator [Photobacterium kishitanii]